MKKEVNPMKNPAIFFGAIAVAIIALLIGIYYTIPGFHHVATFGSHPADQMQPSHMALFYGIFVICVIAALVTRPKSSVR
jgi:hypothetical protein